MAASQWLPQSPAMQPPKSKPGISPYPALVDAPPHHPPRAKRVVYIFQAGAPSHLELFDPKPELTKRNGQLPPAELLQGYRAAFINPNSALLGPNIRSVPPANAAWS